MALTLVGWSFGVSGLTSAMITRRRMVTRARATARACHELRGPLTAARLGLELVARAKQLPDGRLRALELELGRAALAVDDLSRVWQRAGDAAGWAAAERDEQIDVGGLLADSVEAWRPAAGAHGAELRLVPSSVPALVWGRRLRLAQATGNLIANAIEHGGGVVEVSWRADRETVRIEVVDDGGGLPAPVAELIQAHAVRPAVARRRLVAGSPSARAAWGGHVVNRRGHGLAIAGAVAADHGGRLASAPSERGARLVLELPGAPAEPVRTPAG